MRKKLLMAAMVCMLGASVLGGCGKKEGSDSTKSSDSTATSGNAVPSTEIEFVTLSADKLKSIGDYKSFTYEPYSEPDEAYAVEYLDGLIESYVQAGKKGEGEDEERKGTEVKSGDVLNITYKGSVDGEYFEGGEGTTKLTIGSGQFIPGFEDALIGKTIGESTKIDVTFPDPYPNDEKLSGKKAVFEVDIHYVVKEVDITRENAYKVYFGFNSEEELVEDVLSYLKGQVTAESYYSQREYEYIDTILKASEFEDISAEADKLVAQIISSYEKGASSYGIDLSTFVAYQGYSSLDEFKEAMKTAADSQLKTALLLKEIAKKENIEVDQTKIDELLKDLAAGSNFENPEDYLKEWDSQYGKGSCQESLEVRYYENVLFEKFTKMKEE